MAGGPWGATAALAQRGEVGQVVCRQLFSSAAVRTWDILGGVTDSSSKALPLLLGDVACSGDEASLAQCALAGPSADAAQYALPAVGIECA